MTKEIIKGIEWFIIFLWAVIGPIFWFPFLVRMISVFVGTVLVAAGEEGNMSTAQVGLDRAARFYSNGFLKIRTSMREIQQGSIKPHKYHSPKEDFWQPLAIHLGSSVLFWSITMAGFVGIFNV